MDLKLLDFTLQSLSGFLRLRGGMYDADAHSNTEIQQRVGLVLYALPSGILAGNKRYSNRYLTVQAAVENGASNAPTSLG